MKKILLLILISTPAFSGNWVSSDVSPAYDKQEVCEITEALPCLEATGIDRSISKIEGGVFVPDPVKIQAKADAEAAKVAIDVVNAALIDPIKVKLKAKAKLSDAEIADLFTYILNKFGETF